MRLVIETSFDSILVMTKRDTNKILKEELGRLGGRWHKKYAKEHFKMAAFTKYKYKRRTLIYNKLKRRTKHHMLPLVWSGETRERAKQRRLRSTKKYVDVRMSLPTLNFRRGSGPRMREEMERVAPSEERELNTFFNKRMDTRIRRFVKQKQKRHK